MTPSSIQHLLITGASGFVGSNLIPFLQRQLPNTSISILSRTRNIHQPNTILWSELETSATAAVDAVIHLAGKAHDTSNTSAEQEYFNVNFGLTQQLYDWYLKSNAKKFIYLSSVKAVADTVEGILKEDRTPQPKTPYGKSKLQAEQYILNSNNNPHKSYYILRPCMIHGPGNKGNLNLLYQFASKGWPYPLADFENKRSFLSIGNLMIVLHELLINPIASDIFNVADDEALSTNDLIRIMASEQNRPARLWKLPKSIVTSLASLGDVLKLPLSSERLKKLTESYVVSNKKIKTALGIEAMPTSAYDGMIATVKSFK